MASARPASGPAHLAGVGAPGERCWRGVTCLLTAASTVSHVPPTHACRCLPIPQAGTEAFDERNSESRRLIIRPWAHRSAKRMMMCSRSAHGPSSARYSAGCAKPPGAAHPREYRKLIFSLPVPQPGRTRFPRDQPSRTTGCRSPPSVATAGSRRVRADELLLSPGRRPADPGASGS